MQSSEVVAECSRGWSRQCCCWLRRGRSLRSSYTRAVAGSNPVLAGSRRDVSPHSRRVPSRLGAVRTRLRGPAPRRRMRSTSRCCCCCGPSGAPSRAGRRGRANAHGRRRPVGQLAPPHHRHRCRATGADHLGSTRVTKGKCIREARRQVEARAPARAGKSAVDFARARAGG
jgi:hypothetical protein